MPINNKTFFDKSKLKDGFALINKNEIFPTEYMFMGSRLNDFYYDHPGKAVTPSWIKQLMYVISFYLDNRRNKKGSDEHQDFFMATSTVRAAINKLSKRDYCMRTIEKNWNKLEEEGFIKIEWNPIKKSASFDKKNWHNRIIKLNMDFVNQYLSIYSEDDPKYKDLPKRCRIKKFVKARPISYIGNNNEAVIAKFKQYKEAGINKGYDNATDMVYKFADVATKKYQSINKLTNIYTPQFLVSQEEKVKKRIDSMPASYAELTEDDLLYLEHLFKTNQVKYIEQALELVNKCKVILDYKQRFKDIGFIIANESNVIVGFKQPDNSNSKPLDNEISKSSNKEFKAVLSEFYDAIR